MSIPLYQTNCIKCTIALNRRIKEAGKKITADQIANFSMDHPGHCYRNSNLAPSSAKERQAVIASRDLLLDANGKYLGDDQAIYGVFINADNDTRAPKAFIREQNGRRPRAIHMFYLQGSWSHKGHLPNASGT